MRQEESVPRRGAGRVEPPGRGQGHPSPAPLCRGGDGCRTLRPRKRPAGDRPHSPAARKNRPAPGPASFAAAEPARNSGTAVRRNRPPFPPRNPSRIRPMGPRRRTCATRRRKGALPPPDLRIPRLRHRHDRPGFPETAPGVRRGHRGRGTTLGTSPGSATPSSTRSPTRRRRAGWGGKGRSLSLSSFSRTVRYGTCGSCRARGTPPWTGERSTRSETPPRSPAPRWRRRSSPPSSIG